MKVLFFPAFSPTFVVSGVFDTIYSNSSEVGIAEWILIWVLYSVPLVIISVIVLVPCYFYCYGSVVL
jgi:hypothetical protein